MHNYDNDEAGLQGLRVVAQHKEGHDAVVLLQDAGGGGLRHPKHNVPVEFGLVGLNEATNELAFPGG